MGVEYPQIVEARKSTNGGLHVGVFSLSSRVMGKADAQYRGIGERLEAVRLAFSDLNQRDWALKHGFQVSQYNNWETGARRINVDDAEKLCATYGLTLDFIYRGKRDGLADTALKRL